MININKIQEWINDIDLTINNLPCLEKLENKSILVTGSTGLICSSIIDLFIRYNETHKNKIGIIAAGRNIDKVKDRFGTVFNKEYFSFFEYDATKQLNKIDAKCDYIIHGASNAYPAKFSSEPVETMLGNFIGLNNLFDFSLKNKVKRVLFISSSEVYGVGGTTSH